MNPYKRMKLVPVSPVKKNPIVTKTPVKKKIKKRVKKQVIWRKL